jgi:shikimate dehydrogenase
LHDAAFDAVDLDWTYLSFPVPPEALGAAIAGLRALGCLGANVTMPHKKEVIEHLDEVSGDAAAVAAVNTIERIGDKLVGRNTDVDGFGDFLTNEAGWDPNGKRALVLGAGGAARAVIKALDDRGAAGISVAARSGTEDAMAAATRAIVSTISFEDAGRVAGDHDLVVNATPVGMDGKTSPLAAARLREGQVVVDLIYQPPSTPLLEAARSAGAEAWGGIGMLVRQAAYSFQIWTGRQAPVEVMSAAAIRAIRRSAI